MFSVKLQFVRSIKMTDTCFKNLYRDVISKQFVLTKEYDKSMSFYPCDQDGNETPTNHVGPMSFDYGQVKLDDL